MRSTSSSSFTFWHRKQWISVLNAATKSIDAVVEWNVCVCVSDSNVRHFDKWKWHCDNVQWTSGYRNFLFNYIICRIITCGSGCTCHSAMPSSFNDFRTTMNISLIWFSSKCRKCSISASVAALYMYIHACCWHYPFFQEKVDFFYKISCRERNITMHCVLCGLTLAFNGKLWMDKESEAIVCPVSFSMVCGKSLRNYILSANHRSRRRRRHHL